MRYIKLLVAAAVLLMMAAASVFYSCKKEKPEDPVEKAKQECAAKPGENFWNDELNICQHIIKQDVRLGWSLNGSDGNAYFTRALKLDSINKLKELPATGKIIAYVYNEDARGPSEEIWPAVIKKLSDARDAGVKIEPGSMYTYRYNTADSATLKREFGITISQYDRERD
jgi:hypothetical protein